MLQQTPVVRVEPVWHEWLARWPAPADLAAAAPGDAVRAWGRLGYPRRALRLHAAAAAIVQRHDGRVPDTLEQLLDLPGVGVLHRRRRGQLRLRPARHRGGHQLRRVHARAVSGRALPAPGLTRAETELATRLLPGPAADGRHVERRGDGARRPGLHRPLTAVRRLPRRGPVRVAAGRAAGVRRARAPRAGLARHRPAVPGALLSVLRAAHRPVTATALAAAWLTDDGQRERCLDSLVADGLVEPLPRGRFRLPRHERPRRRSAAAG